MITQNKANKMLADYIEAEVKGQNSLAESIENELNEAGWYLVTGSDGLMVEKKGGNFLDSVSTSVFNYPSESKVKPYSPTDDDKSTWNVWIIIGISTGIIGLIALVVYLIKRRKNA